MARLDLNDDIIDVRDIIAEYENLTASIEYCEQEQSGVDPDEVTERDLLKSALDDLKGYGGDHQWQGDWYPVTLIRESYFETYARELAEDIGAVSKDAEWPAYCIDWERAANDLLIDYSEVEIDGTTYYYR